MAPSGKGTSSTPFKKNTDRETKNPDKEKTQRKEFKLYLLKNNEEITHK